MSAWTSRATAIACSTTASEIGSGWVTKGSKACNRMRNAPPSPSFVDAAHSFARGPLLVIDFAQDRHGGTGFRAAAPAGENTALPKRKTPASLDLPQGKAGSYGATKRGEIEATHGDGSAKPR